MQIVVKQFLFIFTIVLFFFYLINIIILTYNNDDIKKCNFLEVSSKFTTYLYATNKEKLFNSDLKFPNLFEAIPHLSNSNQNLLSPEIYFKRNNKYASIVIGISSIKRQNVSYLISMLDSLFKSIIEKEREHILIVLLLADLNETVYKQNLVKELESRFYNEFTTNSIEIISPPIEYYPDFKKTTRDYIFNDSSERIQWRTKQNYDISYLMAYSRLRGKYYLQLEDDIISKVGFVNEILNYIESLKNQKWFMIEFSPLGFIGKLFKTSDLSYFIHMFIMYSTIKPIDMLHNVVLSTLACDPTKDFRSCEENLKKVKPIYQTSLFQHIGVESSLKGKTQKIKDPKFQESRLYDKHINPEATITTSLKVYSVYSLHDCYQKKNFFWSFSPKQNDTINFKFEKPFLLKKVYIRSSNSEHPGDVIPANSTLEIKPIKKLQDTNKYTITNDFFYVIAYFGSNGLISIDLDYNLFQSIDELRIQISQEAKNWILIYEIAFF